MASGEKVRMARLKVGVIGAGLVGQVEHVPNLAALPELFDLTGVADPSPAVRERLAGRYGIAAFAAAEALLDRPLDAVVVASPDALHPAHVAAALERGLHVFCEKPLCFAVEDVRRLDALAAARGLVLQVGYMKRFDPSYEALLALLPEPRGALRQIAVEVTDPGPLPFTRQHAWRAGADVPAGLGDALRAAEAEQVARAVPVALDPLGYRGFTGPYASSLVHDVNAVHGMLDVLGIGDGEIVAAAVFAGGRGGQAAVRLNGGEALWTMSHLTVPGLPHYSERITLTFEDAALELEFPSPYLNHQPTRLILRRGNGATLEAREIRAGYAEAFVEELRGFHAAVSEGAPVRNTARAAARDMALVAGIAARDAEMRRRGT
jgi:predicted dehydrogenase